MKIQISLSANTKWITPSREDLMVEYRYEYALPRRNWGDRCKRIGAPYPLFKDEQDFIMTVRQSPIVELPRNAIVHNMTEMTSIEQIEDMVSNYAYPRDVKRIVQGLTDGTEMPAPIIIRGSKGMWILSGNTRQNCARVLGVPRQFIIVDTRT